MANVDANDQFQQPVNRVSDKTADDMMMVTSTLTGDEQLSRLKAYQRDSMGQWPNPQSGSDSSKHRDAIVRLQFGEQELDFAIRFTLGDQTSLQVNQDLLASVLAEAAQPESDKTKETSQKSKSVELATSTNSTVQKADEDEAASATTPSVSATSYQREDVRTKLLRFARGAGAANTDLEELGWMLDSYRPGPLWLLARSPRLADFSVREPLFEILDLDQDGVIATDEMESLAKLLEDSDRDNNESTAWIEVQKHLPSQVATKESAPGMLFDWAWMESPSKSLGTIEVSFHIHDQEASAKDTLTISSTTNPAHSKVELRAAEQRVDCALALPVRIHFHAFSDPSLVGAARCQCSLAASFRSNQIWSSLDADGDGSIGLGERANIVKQIQGFDLDHDQKVTVSEIPIVMDLILCQGNAAVEQDAQTQQVVKPTKSNVPDKPAPPWFTSMDGNGDGVVSQDEFLGSATQFSKLDKDLNGWIDLNETE